MENKNHHNFKADPELDGMIRDALAGDGFEDVTKSELFRAALMIGIPAVCAKPNFYFGTKTIRSE